MTGLYLRVSKEDGSRQESESIVNQKAFLVDYCKKNGIETYKIFSDDGYSGLHFDRPAFTRMIADPEIDTIITKDLSRLGRDYILTGYYLEKYFPSRGIRYIALNDQIDTSKEIDDMSGFRAVINDMYAKDITKKVRTALTAKKRAGKFIGSSAPYGYRKTKKGLIPEPRQAKVVREIYRSYLFGESMSAIARQLNAKAVKTPSMEKGGKQNLWSDVMIRRILESPTYAGHLTQNKTKRINYKIVKREKIPENLWICVRNTHPPIVSQKVFCAVKKKLTR